MAQTSVGTGDLDSRLESLDLTGEDSTSTIRHGFDFDSWQFHERPESIMDQHRDPEYWATEAQFTWGEGGQEAVERELWLEGVVRLGHVSETYLSESPGIDMRKGRFGCLPF